MDIDIASVKAQQALEALRCPSKPSLSHDSLAGLARNIFQFKPTNEPIYAKLQAIECLKAFFNDSLKSHYSEQTALLAEFILARYLDSYFPGNKHAISTTLPQYSKMQANAGALLRGMQKMPRAFIDILELLALCQAFDPHFDLLEHQEAHALLVSIREAHGEYNTRLSKPRPKPKSRTLAQHARLTMVMSVLICAILILGILASFAWVIASNERSVESHLQTMSSTSESESTSHE